MKPILQRGQRLQKYANTHPLHMRTTDLADHKNRPPFHRYLSFISRRGRRNCREACCAPAWVQLR
jgi:hypothetical protein